MTLELTQVLNMTLPTNTNNAVGAGGVFHTYNMKIDCIEVIKGGETFCDLANFLVCIPTRPGVIPHMVLGRDNIFRKYDITFREKEENTVYRHPKN